MSMEVSPVSRVLGALDPEALAAKFAEAKANVAKLTCGFPFDDLRVKVSYIALQWLIDEHNKQLFEDVMSLIPVPTAPLREESVHAAMRGESGATPAESFMAGILMGRGPAPKKRQMDPAQVLERTFGAIDPILKECSQDEITMLFATATKLLIINAENREIVTLAQRKISQIMTKTDSILLRTA